MESALLESKRPGDGIERMTFDSTAIDYATYDGRRKILAIHFADRLNKNGTVRIGGSYNYFAIPRSLVDEMKACDSIGTFYRERIMDIYESEKVIA